MQWSLINANTDQLQHPLTLNFWMKAMIWVNCCIMQPFLAIYTLVVALVGQCCCWGIIMIFTESSVVWMVSVFGAALRDLASVYSIWSNEGQHSKNLETFKFWFEPEQVNTLSHIHSLCDFVVPWCWYWTSGPGEMVIVTSCRGRGA